MRGVFILGFVAAALVVIACLCQFPLVIVAAAAVTVIVFFLTAAATTFHRVPQLQQQQHYIVFVRNEKMFRQAAVQFEGRNELQDCN